MFRLRRRVLRRHPRLGLRNNATNDVKSLGIAGIFLRF